MQVMNLRIFTKLLVLLFATLSSGSDYYELLGITKDADNKEIRKAFKKLAVTMHPDKNQDDPEAHDKFVKITRAYEVLKDPQQRKQYDLFGEEAPKSSWSQSQYHSYTYYRDHFGIYDDDPQIVTLNTADFESTVVNSDKQWFVNYYSPLCSHCHDLAPVWRQLAQELEGVVMFAAVNCEEDWSLCRQQNIRSYPSLVLYPSNERYSGSRQKEPLARFVLERAEASVSEVRSATEWASLGQAGPQSWVLLLCHCDTLPDCLYDDERTKLAASLNGLVGVAVVDCASVQICDQLTQGEYTSTVYWQRAKDGESFAARTVLSESPIEMAKEVFTYLPDLEQLDAVAFYEMVRGLEQGSETAWLIHFYLGTDSETELEVRKLPALLRSIRVGRVSCARSADVCQELSVSRYPSFAVFKSGGGHEFHHGVVSALGVAQFARESAKATNLRTLSQEMFPQLVTQAADGNSAWFVDFYAPWCPPCLRLLPELRKASHSFDPVVRFGTVDCTVHAALCRQHNVQSYPTTVLFNQSRPVQWFRGEHSATSITDFLQDIISPRVMKLTEESFYTLVGRKSPQSVWIVDFFMPWCGPCQQLSPQWKKLAKMVMDVPLVFVGEVNCEEEGELCSQQGVRSYPTIRLYPLHSSNLNTVAMYSGYQRDALSLRQWLFNFLPSAVETLTEDVFNQAMEGSDYWLIDFYAPWCGHCHAFAPEFATVAKKLEGRVRCGKVNCDEEPKVCQRAGVSAYPTVQFYQPHARDPRGHVLSTQDGAKILSFVEGRMRPSHDEL